MSYTAIQNEIQCVIRNFIKNDAQNFIKYVIQEIGLRVTFISCFLSAVVSDNDLSSAANIMSSTKSALKPSRSAVTPAKSFVCRDWKVIKTRISMEWDEVQNEMYIEWDKVQKGCSQEYKRFDWYLMIKRYITLDCVHEEIRQQHCQSSTIRFEYTFRYSMSLSIRRQYKAEEKIETTVRNRSTSDSHFS